MGDGAASPLAPTAATEEGKSPEDSTEIQSHAAKENAAKLRALCYIAIGKLGLKAPSLVNKDIGMIQTFFEAMTNEDKERQISVQESLSLMAPSFRAMDGGNLALLEAMLATYIDKDEAQVRLVSVQYAGEVFAPNHISTR